MRTADIRTRWLDFFAERDHQVVPSASLVSPDPSIRSSPWNLAVDRCQKSGSRRIIDQPSSVSVSSKTRLTPRTSK